MPGALLRSGSLSEYHSLGAVGKPVFSAAGQLRIAIRRSTDQKTADVFAEPKQNDQGDLIDWYAPSPGDVVPWSAATLEERRSAKAELDAVQATLRALSSKLQADEEANSERKVFGKLLALATLIPSDDHIYVVNGRPVITFWGFHPLDAPADLDVIRDLSVGDASAADKAPPAVATTPLPVGNVPIVDPVMPVEGVAARPARAWGMGWLWFLLPLLGLLLLFFLLTGLKSCGVAVPLSGWLPDLPFGLDAPKVAVDLPDLKPVLDPAGRPVLDAAGRPVWMGADGRRFVVDAEGSPVPIGADGLPLPGPGPTADTTDGSAPAEEPSPTADTTDGSAPAEEPGATLPPADTAEPDGAPEAPVDVDMPPDAASPDAASPEAEAPSPAEPPAAEAIPSPTDVPPATSSEGSASPATPLSIPEQATRSGDTGFLDGQWRSDTGLQDSSGNPLQLGYDFKDGKGTVNLQRSVGGQRSVCSGPASPVMEGGALVITQGQIRCKDGTTFNAPKVVCKMGAGGRANCEGANDDGTSFPVDITR